MLIKSVLSSNQAMHLVATQHSLLRLKSVNSKTCCNTSVMQRSTTVQRKRAATQHNMLQRKACSRRAQRSRSANAPMRIDGSASSTTRLCGAHCRRAR